MKILKVYKVLLLAFLLSIALESNAQKRYQKSKTFSKTFSTNANTKFKLSNKHGKVHVNTYNGNQIKVEAKIIGFGKTSEAAYSMLSLVKVKVEQNGDEISIKTVKYKAQKASTWKEIKKGSYKVNYEVSIPSDLSHLHLSNKFGHTHLGDFSGGLYVYASHGSLTTGKLTGSKSKTVKLAYTNGNNSIEYLNKGKLDISYAGSEVKLGKGGNIDLNLRYSAMSSGSLKSLTGKVAYAELEVDKISEKTELDISHSEFKINELYKKFTNLHLNAKYSDIDIEVSDDTNFDFKMNLSYSDFKANPSKVDFTKKTGSHTSKHYEGRYGLGNNSKKISVNASYSEITLH